jgi:TPR repeat protein
LKSAQLGYAPSQYQLGLAYEYGYLGLPVDPRRSIAWYSKAATQGDPDAELALSGWYLTGFNQVLLKNDHEAYLWARKAADKGLAKAEYAVGYFLEYGVGVQPDFDDARRWYMRSAGQGNKRAVQRLNEINAGVQTSRVPNAAEWRSDSEARNGECSIM